jgi:hypothetical protein
MMKKRIPWAVWPMLLFALAAAPGCWWATEDGFALTWSIQNAQTKQPLSCAQAGASIVRVISTNIDRLGQQFVDDFNCDRGSGITGNISVGHFRVDIELLAPSGAVLSAMSKGVQNITTIGKIDLGHIVFNVSQGVPEFSFGLTWDIVQAASGQPLSCSQAGGTVVRVLSTPLDLAGAQPFWDDFACTAMQGVTGRMPGGSYRVDVQLLDAASAALSQTSLGTKAAKSGGQVDLGHVRFNVN